jgi:hypothetical protein
MNEVVELRLFGFGVTFVLFLSKVYGLIWLIMRDALSVSYFGGRAGNMKRLLTMFKPDLL